MVGGDSGSGDLVTGDCSAGGCTTVDMAGDLERADGVPDSAQSPQCGDGSCDPQEDCLHCPKDCTCSCGDGVCTFGEFCVVCPADCDCSHGAATPPMGWNSWNLFACDIDEALVEETAEALVDTGLAAAGYRYVNIDDCWQVDRTALGVIVEDPVTFASGMGALADKVHALGLKFGVYTCAGPKTCQLRPGSYQFEQQDMQTYADWGVDYVKVDWCSAEDMNAKERFGLFRDAIAATGREILLSICNWGFQDPWIWGPTTGALWRTSGDIFDHVIGYNICLESAEPLAAFARPGHWNDPDMLEVGNGGMTDNDYRAHFSLWAMLAAPLLAGNDVRKMDEATREILLNAEVVAVDQDPSGLQAVVLDRQGKVKVYGRPLTLDGLRAVAFYNTDQLAAQMGVVTWAQVGLQPGDATVRDLWKHEELGSFANKFEVEVAPGAVVLVTIQGQEFEPTADMPLSKHPWKYAAGFPTAVRKDQATNKGALSLEGTTYTTGLGMPGAARVVWHLGGQCSRFAAKVGLDDAADTSATVTFQVFSDGALRYDSGIVTSHGSATDVSVDLVGARELELVVTPASDSADSDMADWAEARIECE